MLLRPHPLVMTALVLWGATTTNGCFGRENTNGQPDAGGGPCALGCVQSDGRCYEGPVDDAHCGVGGERPCLDCTSAGLACLYDPGLDGPKCVCPGTDFPGCERSGSSSSGGSGASSGADSSDASSESGLDSSSAGVDATTSGADGPRDDAMEREADASCDGLPPCPTPVITPPSGRLPSAVTIACPGLPQATIYYTTNGSLPTHRSAVYMGPISNQIGALTINAIASDPCVCADSALASATYDVATTTPKDGAAD